MPVLCSVKRTAQGECIVNLLFIISKLAKRKRLLSISISMMAIAVFCGQGLIAQVATAPMQVRYFQNMFLTLEGADSELVRVYEEHLTSFLGLSSDELDLFRVSAKEYALAEKEHEAKMVAFAKGSLSAQDRAAMAALEAELGRTTNSVTSRLFQKVRLEVASRLNANASVMDKLLKGEK